MVGRFYLSDSGGILMSKKELPVEAPFMSPSVGGHVGMDKGDVVKFLVSKESAQQRKRLRELKKERSKVVKLYNEGHETLHKKILELAQAKHQKESDQVEKALVKLEVDVTLQVNLVDNHFYLKQKGRGKKPKFLPPEKVLYTASVTLSNPNMTHHRYNHNGNGWAVFFADEAAARKRSAQKKDKKFNQHDRYNLELTLTPELKALCVKLQELNHQMVQLSDQINNLEHYLNRPQDIEQHVHSKLVEGVLNQTDAGQKILKTLSSMGTADEETVASFNLRLEYSEDEEGGE